eukprot:UN10347
MGFFRNLCCCGVCFVICAAILLMGAVSYKKLTPTPDECMDCHKERAYGFIGDIAILTHSTSDIGVSTAKALYGNGATVIMASNSTAKGNEIRKQILKELINNTNATNAANQANLVNMQLDLLDFHSVNNFVDQFKSKYS